MTKTINKSFICLILVIISLFTCFFSTGTKVYAEEATKEYSNVLTDLQKDENFNLDDYPTLEDDYSLQLIQIAESVDNELFVYVYQPLANSQVLATSINISQNVDNVKDYTNYKLEYINSKSALFKYKVQDFILDTEQIRYYDISSIFRAFIENIDTPVEDGNTISEVAFSVGKFYTFTTEDNTIKIECNDIELMEVVDKYVGFVRYDGAKQPLFINKYEYLDSHFVAFSTNKQIENLLEADVYFVTQLEDYYAYSGDTKYGNEVEQYVHIDFNDSLEYESGHWYYERSRIQSMSDFIETEHEQNIYENSLITIEQNNELNETNIDILMELQWVLRFYESEYTYSINWQWSDISYIQTNVTDVSILRLTYLTDDVVYNLGVVDNKQTGDSEPINNVTYKNSLNKIWKIILTLLIIVIIIALCAPILPRIANAIVWLIQAIILTISFIVSIPYKLIVKIKEQRAKRKRKKR